MINLNKLNHLRIGKFPGNAQCGAFAVPYPVITNTLLRVIANSYDDWDHVSVSLKKRCPTWEEMDFIKRLFFHPHETAMQIHPSVSKHVNIHPTVSISGDLRNRNCRYLR